MSDRDRNGVWNRREFLSVGLAGTLACQAPSTAGSDSPADIEASYKDNIYTRLLRVRPHLPAHEHISRLGGSRMVPEVVNAMVEANTTSST